MPPEAVRIVAIFGRDAPAIVADVGNVVCRVGISVRIGQPFEGRDHCNVKGGLGGDGVGGDPFRTRGHAGGIEGRRAGDRPHDVRAVSDRVIGEGGFLRIYHPWRSSDISIILGEKSAWGKGYGSEAMALMLDYGFGHLNLHRISLGVFDFNEAAIRFYEKTGFKREGVQRGGYYYDSAYHDIILMSILEDEYRELYQG